MPRQRLRLRGTFIDCEEDGSSSPRAHSEPPQSTLESSLFEFERKYVQKLHESVRGAEVRRLEGPSREARRGAVNVAAVGTGAASTVSLARSDHGLPTRGSMLDECQTAGNACRNPGTHGRRAPAPHPEATAPWMKSGDANEPASASHQWTKDDFVWTRICHNKPKLKEPFAALRMDSLQREHLRSKMEASVQQLSEGWGNNSRLSAALAALEEIPKRIGDDMQNFASHILDRVQAQVAAMSKQIRAGEWPSGLADGNLQPQSEQQPRSVGEWDGAKAAKVVRNLEAIPTMALNLLEARVERTKATVRHRVHGVLQSLRTVQGDRWEDHEKLVRQMKGVLDEVEQLAGEAVESAAEECRTHATRQLDAALAPLREPEADKSQPAALGAFEQDSWRGWQKQEELWPEASGAGAASLKNSVEQAMALVLHSGDKDHNYMPQCVTNEVVADQLLRAKFRNAHSATSSVAPSSALDAPKSPQQLPEQVFTNPGSRGHPDLCPRQCLYFVAGKCSNGNDCGFCHMPHPKRPVRFDKRHRESLKKMPLPELLLVVLPVIRQRAIGLAKCQDIDVLLEKLANCADALGADGFNEARGAESAAGDQCDGGDGTASEASSVRRCRRSSTDAASECESRSSRRADSIRGALHVMALRSLLVLMVRLIPPDATEVRELLEQVMWKLCDNNGESLGQAASGILPSEASVSEVSRLECLQDHASNV